MTISGMLWFIDDSASACTTIAANCGRLSNPFSTLAAFNAVDGGATTNGSDVVDPEAGDHVFIYSGTYAGGLTVENSQRIIGQGALSSLQALSGITPATDSAALPSTGGTKPTINTAGITLAQNNQIHGIAFSGTSGAAIASAANVGTLVMSDITISNTSGGGISLTGGGTATLIGTANTIVTTTGTAPNVVSTNIGAGGLIFRSISASGGTNGIVLSNTGTSGGLTVTGNGGTCTTAVNCSGGAIRLTTADAISLTTTGNVSLDRMFIDSNLGSGVGGTSVTAFSITNSRVTNNGDTATGAEAGLHFTNLHGVSSITNTTFEGSSEDHVRITNSTTGSPNLNLTVSGSTFNANSPSTGQHGIALLGTVTANMTLTVTSTTFEDVRGSSVIMNLADTSSGSLTATSNVFRDIGVAVTLGTSQSADLAFNVSNNIEILRAISNAIQLVAGSDSTNASHIRGVISGNVIGDGTADSGSRDMFGIGIDVRGDQDAIIEVLNNNVRNTDFEGIWVSSADFGAGGQNGRLDLFLRDNVVGTPDDNSGFPVGLIRGVLVDGRHTTTVCMDISGNTSAGIGGGEHFRVRQRDTATFLMERFTDGDGTPGELITDPAVVQAFVAAQNDPGSTANATLVLGFTEAADNSCRPVSTP
jgi:hypothetical protein